MPRYLSSSILTPLKSSKVIELENAMIRTENLSKSYDSTRTVALCGANVSIQRGEFVSITGPSGSGKSTLLNILAGLIKPSQGEVYFEDQALSTMKDMSLYRQKNIGYIFQEFYLYPNFSVIENVLLPLSFKMFLADQWKIRAFDILDYMGLGNKADQNVDTLSAGERQRVCISRAILCDPPLILADEPTGNLDTKNTSTIMELLTKINTEKKTTIIMVTHNLDLIPLSHRNLKIVDGIVCEKKI